MLDALLILLPSTSPVLAGAAVLAALLGLMLWITGARYSQAFFALAAVGLGAWLGLHLPAWVGLSISTWATAIGGALALGLGAYIYQHACETLALAVVMVLWAGLATWAAFPHQHVPAVTIETGEQAVADGALPLRFSFQSARAFRLYVDSLWDSLSPEMRRYLPFGAAAALLSGIAIGILYPRFAQLVLHSMLGLTMAVLFGLLAVRHQWPDALARLKPSAGLQAGLLGAALLVGLFVQWRFTAPAPARQKQGA